MAIIDTLNKDAWNTGFHYCGYTGPCPFCAATEAHAIRQQEIIDSTPQEEREDLLCQL